MITKKKIGWFVLMLLMFSLESANGQEDQKQDQQVTLKDRLYFGGNLALGFGQVTIIEIAPVVGYRITPHWSVGVGPSYEYYKTSGNYFGNFSTSIYGLSVFTDYIIWKNVISKGISLVTHIEYEALNLDQKYFKDAYLPHGRFVLNEYLVGGGIREHIGRRSSVNILILWNLNQTRLSPTDNPQIRFNFYL
jgi:hypothetical protein